MFSVPFVAIVYGTKYPLAVEESNCLINELELRFTEKKFVSEEYEMIVYLVMLGGTAK